jgi:hypothetical protein
MPNRWSGNARGFTTTAVTGVDRVERFEQCIREALGSGQEGFVIPFDLDQHRFAKPA